MIVGIEMDPVVPEIDSKAQRIMSGIKGFKRSVFVSDFFYLQFSEK
jgi:hypothetical protein